ncbi:hypothetical protein IJ670_01695 [bacterium]|nr:hypothetical protein [bacterium]
MQNIKSSVFLYLTKRQKSQLLGTLKSYFKKFQEKSKDEIIQKFLDDEKYYIDMNNPHFEFVGEYFNSDVFYRDIKKYFVFLDFEQKQKAQMEPYLQKKKEQEKLLRKKAQEFKMSKLKPTQKQIKYYEKLSKAHNVELKDINTASRLDLRNWIMEIIDEYN